MKTNFFVAFIFLLSTQLWAINPGENAVDFELKNQMDKTIKLSDYKGKYIILEWYNRGCPYVKKHYSGGNMQAMQKLYAANEQVVWLSIVSSTQGKQGYFASAKQSLEQMQVSASKADHVLRDLDGKVGQAYQAKTTPHMFIIDPNFKIRYVGAIDSIASADPADIKKADNYVTMAMSKLMLGENPKPSKTRPYGCSVKY